MAPELEHDAVTFAEKVIALLDGGSFTSTYKYAVLLGLMDLCLEGADRTGAPPSLVTTEQLARKVLELYWPHTSSYAEVDRVLVQNGGGQAEILQLIARFRASHAPDPSAPLARAARHCPAELARLVCAVEWKLVEMPLPKLQRLGRSRGSWTQDRFIYEIGWDDDIRRRTFADPAEFINAIHFVPGAADHLVRLAGLLRPLIQREWARMIAQLNGLPDAGLHDFLFGQARIDLSPVSAPLRELQDSRCFYCEGRLASLEIDHFIPWARHPNNAVENLVAAHKACNNAKRDFLAAADHVDRWIAWVERRRSDLDLIAEQARWEREPVRSLGVVRSVYLRLHEQTMLWLRASEFVHAEPDRLARILAETA